MTESAKEYKYGTQWAYAISIIITLALAWILMTLFPYDRLSISNERLTSLSLVILGTMLLTFPSFLRGVLCVRWPSATAHVLSTKDLSRVETTGHGGSHWVSFYKASLEYEVAGHKYTGTAYSKETYGSTAEIFYKPSDPSIFTQKRGYDWYGKTFIACVIVLSCTSIARFIYRIMQ